MSPRMPVPTIEFLSHSTAHTRQIGERLGQLAQPGDVLCLEGPLGSGKTVLAQGIGRGLGIREPVSSPSFTLINEYRGGRLPLFHIDLYRLETDREVWDLGLVEYLEGDGLSVVEWADRAARLMPSERLWITLRHRSDSKRGIAIQAQGLRPRALLAGLERMALEGG